MQAPFGDAFRCIDGMMGTVNRIYPIAMTSATGQIYQTADNTIPTHAPHLGVVGTTLNFQGWFRDPAAGLSGFNLTDGVGCTMEP